MGTRSRTQAGKWARRIGGGALVLALAGLPAPATTSAVIYQDNTPEVIEVEGEAPWGGHTGGHNGAGATNGTPTGDSGGGSGGGGTSDGGGGTGSSTAGQQRLTVEKQECLNGGGVWGSAVFKDLETNIAYAGYSCRTKLSNGQYLWFYFDSEGNYHYSCQGDLEVQTCG